MEKVSKSPTTTYNSDYLSVNIIMPKKRNRIRKTKTLHRAYKAVSTILILVIIFGVGYILYDIFRVNIDASVNKLTKLVGLKGNFLKKLDKGEITSTSRNERIQIEAESKGNNLPEDKLFFQNSSKENSFQTNSYTNTSFKPYREAPLKLQTTNEISPKHSRKKIFLYRVSGDKLVFLHREAESRSGNLQEVFEILKETRSSGNEISFVNSKVRLIDYRVVNDTLILNLSRDIEENEYGGLGILYSIYQIAYTLGNSTGVKNVLVLIEGEKPLYVGGEGIVLRNPIDITTKPSLN